MNKFEKYLKQYQKELEVDEVNPQIWERMEEQLQQPKRNYQKQFLRVASIAAVFFLGMLMYPIFFDTDKAVIPQELLTEYGFDNQDIPQALESKIQLIREMPVSVQYKNDLQLLIEQVEYLDQNYGDQLTDLEEEVFEEGKVKEVLKYYQIKSALLDKLINEIKKLNNNDKKFNNENEKTFLNI